MHAPRAVQAIEDRLELATMSVLAGGRTAVASCRSRPAPPSAPAGPGAAGMMNMSAPMTPLTGARALYASTDRTGMGFPTKVGKTVKTRLTPGHEWVCNSHEATGVTRVTDRRPEG